MIRGELWNDVFVWGLVAAVGRSRPDLALAMADELAETRSVCRWAGGEKRPDTLVQAAEAFTTLAGTLEFSVGVDAALAHLRALNAVQVERACTLGWAFRDAEAAEQAKQADLRLGTAKAAGYDGLLGELHEQVRRTRSTWTTCALAARAVQPGGAFSERPNLVLDPGSGARAGVGRGVAFRTLQSEAAPLLQDDCCKSCLVTQRPAARRRKGKARAGRQPAPAPARPRRGRTAAGSRRRSARTGMTARTPPPPA